MKTKFFLGIALVFLMILPIVSSANIVYYAQNAGVEIEVPAHKYIVIYDSMYNSISSAEYNMSNKPYHCATYFAVAICDTYEEYVSVIQSIDPYYQF